MVKNGDGLEEVMFTGIVEGTGMWRSAQFRPFCRSPVEVVSIKETTLSRWNASHIRPLTKQMSCAHRRLAEASYHEYLKSKATACKHVVFSPGNMIAQKPETLTDPLFERACSIAS